MLQRASKDPETFEKFIEETMAKRKKPSAAAAKSEQMASAAAAKSDEDSSGEKKQKKKYVPIEEWDAQRKNGENMTREERLQWECQRMGNQFRQNEILRHNLKSF